ncbi:MAG TPA: hypothetical protein VK424_08935 [Thermoplasmata archaeon]|nr:hypothetical protein [Thermoplasmata archaeon]
MTIVAIVIALASPMAYLGIRDLATGGAGTQTVTIGNVTFSLVPAKNFTDAPNGTGPIGGACMSPAEWADQDQVNGVLGPPFAPNSNVSCLFAMNYSSYYHPPTNGSRAYLISLASVNVTTPFVKVGPLYTSGGPPPNKTAPDYVGLVFRTPGQPGFYNVNFTVYYEWIYT